MEVTWTSPPMAIISNEIMVMFESPGKVFVSGTLSWKVTSNTAPGGALTTETKNGDAIEIVPTTIITAVKMDIDLTEKSPPKLPPLFTSTPPLSS
jgi:hypothetical protein